MTLLANADDFLKIIKRINSNQLCMINISLSFDANACFFLVQTYSYYPNKIKLVELWNLESSADRRRNTLNTESANIPFERP